MNVTSALLLTSQVLFLWMFWATEPLELMADASLIPGPKQLDVRAVSYDFAARWRHGMAGGWPIFMPGFFGVAMSVWLWSLRKDIHRACLEGASMIFAASLIALLFQPLGTSLVVKQFEEEFDVICPKPPPAISGKGILRGIYTLVTFAAGIISIQRVIVLRRPWPLVIPVVMNIILAMIRPWTVGDFTSYWIEQVRKGDFVAGFSAIAVVLAAIVMFWSQWVIESRCRKEGYGQKERYGSHQSM